MGRPRRNFEPGELYLVCHIGNKNLSVYLDAADHEQSLKLLSIAAKRYHVTVHAYSQAGRQGMWIFEPTTRDGISNLMRDMQGGYSRYLNRRYHHRHWLSAQSGGPRPEDCEGMIERSVNWPGRYRCIRIPRSLLLAFTHIVEVSPAAGNGTPEAAAYPWSSAPARIAGRCVRTILELINRDVSSEHWSALLRVAPPLETIANIELALRRGRLTEFTLCRLPDLQSATAPG